MGRVVGRVVGTTVGCTVGASVGTVVGTVVGVSDGTAVGEGVGAIVNTVGEWEGATEGLVLGSAVPGSGVLPDPPLFPRVKISPLKFFVTYIRSAMLVPSLKSTGSPKSVSRTSVIP